MRFDYIVIGRFLLKFERLRTYSAIIIILFTSASPAWALRVAMWHSEFSADGPGVVIARWQDDRKNEDWRALAQNIRALQPDILLLTNVDQDDEAWLAKILLAEFDIQYAQIGPSNRGLSTGFDLNHDNRINAQDRQGYGEFRGARSLLLLSQIPAQSQTSFNHLLLKNFSRPPEIDGEPYYADGAWEVLRLTPTGLWDHDFGEFHILSAHANTPALDGAEKRNALRNAAEISWWQRYISGESFESDQGESASLDGPFILMGTLNLDDQKGKGERSTMTNLLENPRLNPVKTKRRATVDWSRLDLGEMRVDYILPSCEFEILKSGQLDLGTEHALIWADLKQRENCNWR